MRALRVVPFLLLASRWGSRRRPRRPAARPEGRVAGLDSPRHLEFGARGDLFVAEAGERRQRPCFDSAEGDACMGATGAVTKVDRWGRQSRVAKRPRLLRQPRGHDSGDRPARHHRRSARTP